MIKKIINNLKKPHLIPQKVLSKLFNVYYEKNYDSSKYINEQNQLFEKLSFNREKALTKLDKIKKNYDFLVTPMSSEHQIIFSSISEKKKINQILEIGTYDGTNAFLLSKLFPEANITTIDLKDDEDQFKKIYARDGLNKLNEFCKKRDKILTGTNINFEQTNSINLSFSKKQYDLIWIDGAHGYPMVTIDIVNSIRLLNDDGIIMCDDIFTRPPKNQDSMYDSIAAYETLNEFKKANVISCNLLFKRLDKKNNSNPNSRQFLAFIKKIK
jgi:predicted O-methyltransferase YrrM